MESIQQFSTTYSEAYMVVKEIHVLNNLSLALQYSLYIFDFNNLFKFTMPS